MSENIIKETLQRAKNIIKSSNISASKKHSKSKKAPNFVNCNYTGKPGFGRQ